MSDIPTWSEVPSSCVPEDYGKVKAAKRGLQRARGNLVIDDAEQNDEANKVLTCMGLPKYEGPDTGGPGVPPQPDPQVWGPFTTKGHKYWIQLDADDKWFVWFDVDPDDGPDVRILLSTFLDDDSHDEVNMPILRKARNFGYEG